MKTELRPCPFCGGRKAYLDRMESGSDEDSFIHCPECGADGPYYGGTDSTLPHEAVELWNHRPQTDKAVGMLSDLHMRVTLARADDEEILDTIAEVIKELER